MKMLRIMLKPWLAIAAVFFGAAWVTANATEPCDDFGECKVLIEINATDGDAGFHFLGDGDELIKMEITDPDGRKVFENKAKGPLREQTLTENFAESAEPLCWYDPEADEDEEVVTLEEFLERWTTGTYEFFGLSAEGEMSYGETDLTFELPAAPYDVDFELEEEEPGSGEYGGEISWEPGFDLGNCAEDKDERGAEANPDAPDLADVVDLLDEAPVDVIVDAWEIVVEPDYDDEEFPVEAALYNNLTYALRIPGMPAEGEYEIEVPDDYLEQFPDCTPLKIEVGAIGGEDNATFTEEDGFFTTPDCED